MALMFIVLNVIQNLTCQIDRFRFLAVRESKNNSRFQIGNIDLYAAN